MPACDTDCLIAGCGYLGLRAAEAFITQGRSVHAITRGDERARRFRAAGLTPVVLDLNCPPDQAVLPSAENVLWSVGFDPAGSTSREQIWIDGLRWLIENLPSEPERFIYVSSTSVYGEQHGECVDETTEVNPASDGGRCCVRGEQLVRELCATRFPDTRVIVLRMAGIYGPDRLLRRVTDLRQQKPLPGTPSHCLNLIHVDDAVRMILAVLSADPVPEVINVVNANTITRKQYYSRLAELVAAPAPVFATVADPSAGRARGGNKRVVSVCRPQLDVTFSFDDVAEGLSDAVRRST